MDEAALLAAAADYVAWDPNTETRAEVKAHLDAKDVAALSKLLDTKLECNMWQTVMQYAWTVHNLYPLARNASRSGC